MALNDEILAMRQDVPAQGILWLADKRVAPHSDTGGNVLE